MTSGVIGSRIRAGSPDRRPGWWRLGALVLATLLSLGTMLQAGTPAESVVTAFADKAFDALRGPREAASGRMVSALRDFVAVEGIVERVLGDRWNDLSAADRRTLVAAYEGYLADAFAARIADYRGEEPVVLGSRDLSGGDALVALAIESGKGRRVTQWRVRPQPAGHRIIDLFVDGVSMVATQSEETGAFLAHHGGDVEALVGAWRAWRDQE